MLQVSERDGFGWGWGDRYTRALSGKNRGGHGEEIGHRCRACCRKGTVKILQLPRGRAWASWSSQAEGSGRSGCWGLPGARLFMTPGHTFTESSQRGCRVKYSYQSTFFYFYVPLVGSAKSVHITFKKMLKVHKR